MVYNDILKITLTLYFKLVNTRDVCSSYIGVLRRLQRACAFTPPCQSFCISHIQSMNVEGDTKVSKGAKIRNGYNQVPHLTQDTQDTNGKVTNSL